MTRAALPLSPAQRLDEGLLAAAPRAFELAHELCVDCQRYHALRPYLRLSGEQRGVDTDWDVMEPLLAAEIAGGRRRVLIVGSGDTGITNLVLSAARGTPVAVTVIDRCATPLVLIHEMAARHGLRVRTLQKDLRQIGMPGAFDLVVGHHVIPFLPPAGRLALLEGAREALAPNGRLVMATRDAKWRSLREQRYGSNDAERARGFVTKVETALKERRIAAPPGAERLTRHLHAQAVQRSRSDQNYDPQETLQALFLKAGFHIEQQWAVEDKRASDGPRAVGQVLLARPGS